MVKVNFPKQHDTSTRHLTPNQASDTPHYSWGGDTIKTIYKANIVNLREGLFAAPVTMMPLTWVGVVVLVVRLGAQPDLHLGHGAEGDTQPEPAAGHHHRRHQH